MKTKQISLSLKIHPYHMHTIPFCPLSPSYPQLRRKQSSSANHSVCNAVNSNDHSLSKQNRLLLSTSNHFHRPATTTTASSNNFRHKKHSMSPKNIDNPLKNANPIGKVCFVNKRLLVTQLYKDANAKHKGNASYNKQSKHMSFLNQTLSSLYKIDHTMFRLNNKLKKEIEKNLFDNPKRKDTARNAGENEKGLSSCDTVMDKLNSFIRLSRAKMGVDKKQPVSYLKVMEKELKMGIKKHDGYIKQTIGSLRRLQTKNDEKLTKNTFVHKTMFKQTCY